MDKNFVNSFLISNGKYFPSNKLGKIGALMENSAVSEYSVNRRFYNPLVITIIFWVFWPFQLFDRFVLRDWFGGSLKLFFPIIIVVVYFYGRFSFGEEIMRYVSLGMLGFWVLWTIVDGFTIYHRTKSANYRSLLKALNIYNDNYIPQPISNPKNALKEESNSNDILEWRKANPNASINDFYKKKFEY